MGADVCGIYVQRACMLTYVNEFYGDGLEEGGEVRFVAACSSVFALHCGE